MTLIALFGATGGTGRQVVAAAQARGHIVRALVRDPSRAHFEGVDVVRGDAKDPDAVASVLVGADAAVSSLGIASGGPPTTDHSDAMRTVAGECVAAGVGQLVIVANARVFDDEPATQRFAAVVAEHRRNIRMLSEGGLPWVAGCPVVLQDEPPLGTYRTVVGGPPPLGSITRSDLAEFLLDALAADGWLGHAVGVSN